MNFPFRHQEVPAQPDQLAETLAQSQIEQDSNFTPPSAETTSIATQTATGLGEAIAESLDQNTNNQIAHSEHIVTFPNFLTLLRAVGSPVVAYAMARGKRFTGIATIGLAATDKESWPADLIDKWRPNSGRGRTALGKRADPIADTVFGASLAAGTLASPKASGKAKIASAINTAKVTEQATWAQGADKKHRKEFGEPLVADVDTIGKVATFVMMTSESAAALTASLDPNKPRQASVREFAGNVALLGSAVAYVLGRKAYKKHDANLEAKITAKRALSEVKG